MTDRDKLIELHEEAGVEWNYYVDECINEGKVPSKTYDEFHADHLLANGVIVPPCKVGDIVWNVCADDIVRPWKVKFRTFSDKEGWWIFLDWEGEDRHAKCSGDCFREKYFLTKEEAEAELRKRGASNAENN